MPHSRASHSRISDVPGAREAHPSPSRVHPEYHRSTPERTPYHFHSLTRAVCRSGRVRAQFICTPVSRRNPTSVQTKALSTAPPHSLTLTRYTTRSPVNVSIPPNMSRADTTQTKPPQHTNPAQPPAQTTPTTKHRHTPARQCSAEWAHLHAVLCSPESTTCNKPLLEDPRPRWCDHVLGHGRTETFAMNQNTHFPRRSATGCWILKGHQTVSLSNLILPTIQIMIKR